MNDIAFTRTLFSGHNLKIRSFMRLPTVYFGNSTVGTITTYPVILISYDPPKTAGTQQIRPKDAQFKVNPRNMKRVTQFFKKIYSWFDSDEYKDLFIIDEREGKLIINMDFRNTMAKIGSTKYEAQALLAVPTVVEFDSIQSEGCALAINNTSYTCPLTDLEVESILGILENFSFQAESQLLMTIGLNKNFVTTTPQQRSSGQKINW